MFAPPARIWTYTYGNNFRSLSHSLSLSLSLSIYLSIYLALSLYALLISKDHKTHATAAEDVAVGCPFGLCQ